MNQTSITPKLPYWAIVSHTIENWEETDEDGCSGGTTSTEYTLVEFQEVLELEEYLSEQSERAGESFGEYRRIYFNVIKLYTTWDVHNSDVKEAEEWLKMDKEAKEKGFSSWEEYLFSEERKDAKKWENGERAKEYRNLNIAKMEQENTIGHQFHNALEELQVSKDWNKDFDERKAEERIKKGLLPLGD